VTWPEGTVRRHVEEGARVVFGRADDCDLRIQDAAISRHHCAFIWAGNPRVEDLGSTHGTRVGRRILRKGESIEVTSGTVIDIGPATIVFHDPVVSPATVEPSAFPRLMESIARSNLSVLIVGETGAGKEITADRLHALSPRRNGPHIKINCGAIASNLIESELFGHERGAFTGADRTKAGLFEAANGGTLFLDEVGELTASTQVQLLRVLESREVRRLGSVTSIPIDVRVLAATHRDLRALMKAGSFREDLYYRLNGMTIRVPALRERFDELPALVRELARRESGRDVVIESSALALLRGHRWPGNVRELRNVVARALVLAGDAPIQAGHILIDEADDSPSPNSPKRRDLKAEVDDFEHRRVLEALEATQGNQTKAAALLGITRRALQVRMATYGIAGPRK
jgi:transcriptional regulator with PAS, ATPase and Fis domain